MTAIILKAEPREPGVKATKEIKSKKIPAVVYGPKATNQNILIETKEFERALREAGESTLIDLTVADKTPVKVLVHALQRDPVGGNYIHVDFYQLDMSKKTKVDVELKFLSLDEVTKLTGGEISESVDALEVECLPQDLIKELEVDLSVLKNIGDVLYAKDIKLPHGLELISDPELPVASLRAIVEEKIEEAAPAEEAPAPLTEKEAKAKAEEAAVAEEVTPEK
ncbi:MAG TPA: 50S ribosomal protein L25 [Patescibacteria group bacterium]|nr:50S ribosomal protein L25 [Patescibacteria group bacterium]